MPSAFFNVFERVLIIKEFDFFNLISFEIDFKESVLSFLSSPPYWLFYRIAHNSPISFEKATI